MKDKKKLEILVIEDNPKHLADAKKQLEKSEIKVDYATTFNEARDLMKSKKYDGIISDIFFPASKEKKIELWVKSFCYDELEDHGVNYPDHTPRDFEIEIIKAADEWMEGRSMHPTGVLIAKEALEKGIPIVLCTDTYHHGYKTQPVFSYAGEKGIPFIDVKPDDYGNKSNFVRSWDKKNWSEALDSLLDLRKSVSKNIATITGAGIKYDFDKL